MAKLNKEEVKEVLFTKEQILASKKYQKQRDILSAILSDACYSIAQVDTLIQKFRKGKVN